jgi:hypothetical protein
LWQQVAALTPDGPCVIPVLALLAVAAWAAGNGTLSNLAIDRGTQIDDRRATNALMLDLMRTILDRREGRLACVPHDGRQRTIRCSHGSGSGPPRDCAAALGGPRSEDSVSVCR